MSISQDVRAALQKRLAATPGIPAIAYEGKRYSPTKGTAFVVPVIVSGTSRPFSLDNGTIEHLASFEVAVVYPTGNGTGAVEAMADTIRERFRPGTVIYQNSVAVKIRWAERRQTMHESDWIRVPVSIGYRVMDPAT